MKAWLGAILCRLGLHSRERFVYENAELPGLRWHVERCWRCGVVFVFEVRPADHPNCPSAIVEEVN